MTTVELLTQAGFFAVPIIGTLIVFYVRQLRGKKTKINGSFLAGLELINFGTWLPDDITHPLMTGFAIATLMSATLLSEGDPQYADPA